jgi:hypothetical protein
MSYAKDRDEFVAIMTKEGVPLWDIQKVLRHSATIQRLSAEACNRELKDTELLDRIHATKQLIAIGENNHFMPCFSSDPRGATVKLKVPSGKTNDWGEVGVCVPTRSY